MLKKKKRFKKRYKKDKEFKKQFDKDLQDEIDKKSNLNYEIEDKESLKKQLMDINNIEFETNNQNKNKIIDRISKLFAAKKLARNFVIVFVMFIIFFGFITIVNTATETSTSFQYQTNMNLTYGTMNLKYVTYDKENNKLILDFKSEIKATEGIDMKRPYMIIKSFDNKGNFKIMYEEFYNPQELEDIEFDVSEQYYKRLAGLQIEIYEIRDEKEIESELTKYIQGCVVFKENFRDYENLDDFFEESKSRSEKIKEINYIQKIVYSNNNIDRYDDELLDNINKVFAFSYSKTHKIIEQKVNEFKQVVDIEKQVLIDIGMTEEAFNLWFKEQKENEFNDFTYELEILKNEESLKD